jgi:MFS family permease
MRKKSAAAELDANGKKPLRLDYPQTIKVGLAFAGITIFWTAYDFVIPLLLEQAFGLSNTMRGLVMGLDNLLALFMLPLFGRLSDKAHGKFVDKVGKRTPFIVCGTVAAVVLMIFVPLSAQKQLESSYEIRAGYLAQLDDEAFMSERLEEFYGDSKYCDMLYINGDYGISEEGFKAIRFDSKLETESGFLGIGGKTYKYGTTKENTVEVSLDDVEPVSGKTYREIKVSNDNYDKYVKSGMNVWISEQVEKQVMETGVANLSIFMAILFLVLLSMATYRSPAVALMPDVTPKPLRSQANAMINLMGGVGGAVAFLIYTVVLFGDSLYNYMIIFGCIAAAMLIILALYLIFVKERKLVEKCKETCEEYGITDEENEQNELAKLSTEAANDELIENANAVGVKEAEKDKKADKLGSFNKKIEDKFNAKYSHLPPEERKVQLQKAKNTSFILILASIFMWFMGYNAVSSNLSIYCVKALNLSAGVASIISGVSMGISAIAFIPVGMLAVKIGRRKSIMLGFGLAVVSFLLIYTPLIAMANVTAAKAALFSVFYLIAGFGLIIANVNTFPMVVELSTADNIGKYTGFYYTATMSAQAITPFIAGAIMDTWGSSQLFIYSAICVVVAIALMLFVRYGDSVQLPTGKKMSKEQKKQVMLESMGDAD